MVSALTWHSAFFSIFLCCLIFLSLVPVVSAVQYVSFAQPDTLTQKDIYLYSANGSLLGLYNTTSSGIELPASGDLMFVLKPQYSNPLDDPATWLNSLVSWAQSNAVSLLFIAILLGYVISRRN